HTIPHERRLERNLKSDEASEVLLFTTTKESIYEDFANHNYSGFRARVEELRPSEIAVYLDARWKFVKADETVTHPFEMNGIKKVFEGRNWTFLTVAKIMEEVWKEHANCANPAAPAAETVPSEVIVSAAWDYIKRVGVLR